MKNEIIVVDSSEVPEETSNRGNIRMREKIYCKDCSKEAVTMLSGWVETTCHATLKCKLCHASYSCKKVFLKEVPQENYHLLQQKFELDVLAAYRSHKKTDTDVRGLLGVELKLIGKNA